MEKRMNQQIAQGQIPVCDLVDMHPQITPGYLLRIAYIALQHLKSKTLLQMEGRKSRLEKNVEDLVWFHSSLHVEGSSRKAIELRCKQYFSMVPRYSSCR